MRTMGNVVLDGNQYEDINMLGQLEFMNQVTVDTISITGEVTAKEELEFKLLKLTGKLYTYHSVKCEEIACTGEIKIDENLACKRLKLQGQMNVKGNISGERVTVLGVLDAEGDCEVDELNVNGKVDINGLLNADSITIKVQETSTIQEIGGDRIKIMDKRKASINPFRKISYLETETIEGNTIDINAVKAKVVSGDHITIGEDAEIDRVEYSGTINISPKANVKEVVQI